MNMLKVNILSVLEGKKASVPIRSLTVVEVATESQNKPNTIHKNIIELLNDGYVGKGYKNGRALTYYITEKGIELLNEMK